MSRAANGPTGNGNGHGSAADVIRIQGIRKDYVLGAETVHALRGWPTPMGATIRVGPDIFSPDGNRLDERSRAQLELVGRQVVDGARSLASLGAKDPG